MPTGIPVATVAIDGAKNAAYLAAQIIALSDKELSDKIKKDRVSAKETVLQKNANIENKFNK